MGKLFVIYGDILSKEILSLADVIAMPAFKGKMKPQDELTERFFELSGEELEREITDKYGNEPMGKGDVRVIENSPLIETTLFVNAVYLPIWDLSDSDTERGLILGYHNPMTIAYCRGNKSILLPYIGMSLNAKENEYMIKRIRKMLLKEVNGNRSTMDIYFVIPMWLGLSIFAKE